MKKELLEVLKENYKNKAFTSKEAKELKVSRGLLGHYIRRGKLKRIGHGLYIFPDYDADEEFQFSDMALLAKRSKGAVICLISALSYWDLTDHIPREFWLAIPNNCSFFKHTEPIRFIRPRDLTTGIIEKVIAGETIKITDRERSICDAFKHLDLESAITCLRMYLEQDKEKILVKKLLDMAKKLKVKLLLKVIDDVLTAQAREYPALKDKAYYDALNWFSEDEKQKVEGK